VDIEEEDWSASDAFDEDCCKASAAKRNSVDEIMSGTVEVKAANFLKNSEKRRTEFGP
jgi:hypothetical protein